jgi:hypothetical protein
VQQDAGGVQGSENFMDEDDAEEIKLESYTNVILFFIIICS